jgi:hypothetical protein
MKELLGRLEEDTAKMPFMVDSAKYYSGDDPGYFAEMDGFHYEAETLKDLIQQMVKYAYEAGLRGSNEHTGVSDT